MNVQFYAVEPTSKGCSINLNARHVIGMTHFASRKLVQIHCTVIRYSALKKVCQMVRIEILHEFSSKGKKMKHGNDALSIIFVPHGNEILFIHNIEK